MEFSDQKVEYLKCMMISSMVSVLKNVLLFLSSQHFTSKKLQFLAKSLLDHLSMDGVRLRTDSQSAT